MVLQAGTCRSGSGLRNRPRSVVTVREYQLASRCWLAADESRLGARIFHPGELLGRGRAAMAPNFTACTVLDLGSRINRHHLLLTIPDSFFRADALVLVWFYATAHSLNYGPDNGSVVGRVCMVVLSYL